MKNKILETIIGIIIILFSIGFYIFIKTNYISNPDIKKKELLAKFTNADGILSGSDVKISGVKIGEIKSINLDPKSFLAIATLSVDDNLKIPVDSTAYIRTANLIGSKYIEISLGSDEDHLSNNDEIENTSPSLVMEELIGKLMVNFVDKKN